MRVSIARLCVAWRVKRITEPGIWKAENAHMTLIVHTCSGLLVCIRFWFGHVLHHPRWGKCSQGWCEGGRGLQRDRCCVGEREKQTACSLRSQTSILWTLSCGLFPGPAAASRVWKQSQGTVRCPCRVASPVAWVSVREVLDAALSRGSSSTEPLQHLIWPWPASSLPSLSPSSSLCFSLPRFALWQFKVYKE